MSEKITTETVNIGGRDITFEVGRLAPQASSSVMVSCGDTVVLATVMTSKPRTDIGYFPLSVDFAERLYAGGKIKGSRWVKREGKPTDGAILAGRVIDRSIRPLFPKLYKDEVQVIVTLLSIDEENAPDMLGLLGVSAALSLSSAPWDGPVGGIRIGLTQADGESNFVVNPSMQEREDSLLNLVVATNKEKVHMIEADAQEVPEDVMAQAIKTAKEEIAPAIAAIEKLTKKAGQQKQAVPVDEIGTQLQEAITKKYKKELEALVETRLDRKTYQQMQSELAEKILSGFAEDEDVTQKKTEDTIEYLVAQIIRANILTKKKRLDGRKVDEVRSIDITTGLLPRTHGSAVFARGITQALTVATLGSPSLEQIIENPISEEHKRYMHHYNMPPYSVGETGRFGFPKRREIGHGALAEKALEPVLPSKEDFPYTIRLVSEIMSSNGSTSMASVCGSTLALMDAGVPITSPVAGISVGLVEEKDAYQLLTDIVGVEDFTGDMDFKVAGTKTGITAIQLDVKNNGLTESIVTETLTQAHTARMQILDIMAAAVPEAKKVSQYAPKIEVVRIPVEKIGEIIGPGGRIIKRIIAETGSEVNVEDDGAVTISGTDAEGVAKATQWVKDIVREVVADEEFEGTVTRIVSFGMFVEILPGKEGLVHVSQMATGFVDNPADHFELNQKVKVKVREVDDQGRINLTMVDKVEGKEGGGRPPGGDRPPRSGNRGRDRDRGRRFDSRRR